MRVISVSCNRLHLPEGVASSEQGVALTFQLEKGLTTVGDEPLDWFSLLGMYVFIILR